MHRSILLALIATPLWALTATAQIAESDSARYELPTVEVLATFAAESEANAPRSLYVYSRANTPLEAAPSLQRALRGLPGVQLNDRGHYALGERLLIRGMGYRAAFGVRGAQVFLDGIPLTIADGQTMMDIVEPGMVGGATVLRGPASLFWGNSSGGALFLRSVMDSAHVRVRGFSGHYGQWRFLANGHFGAFRGYLSGVQPSTWREHSGGRIVRFGGRLGFTVGGHSTLAFTLAGALQDIDAPGALTKEQFETNPTMADPRNVAASAGKETTHVQAGGTWRSQLPFGQLTVSVYALVRELYNPLSFAIIDLLRLAGGTYGQLQSSHGRLHWTAGWDVRLQGDDRLRVGTSSFLDHVEQVESQSGFGLLKFDLTRSIQLTAGARSDWIQFSIKGNSSLSEFGSDALSRSMHAISPSLGIAYRRPTWIGYANYSTAFESPTTTELVNRPGADGSLNPDLGPQRTRGMEAGVRGIAPRLRLQYDLALYSMRLTDRLLPRQDSDGHTWYVNEGDNNHRGVDLAVTWPLDSKWQVRLAYSGGRYVFLNEPGEGLHIPGVPSHQGFTGLRFAAAGFRAEVATSWASGSWANSSNEEQSDGHFVVDLYFSHTGFRLAGVTLQPFLSVHNSTDATYASSLVVNAFGGRYYEPAPGRNVQVGASLLF